MSNIQIINQDCLLAMKEMPDKAFDLAIVDPNYGIGESSANFRSRDRACKKWKNPTPSPYEQKSWDDKPPSKEYFTELFRVSTNQIIFGANYFTQYLPPSMGWIFWDKQVQCDFSDGELAFTSFKRALKQFTFLWSGFAKAEPIKRIHPTQKPVALYQWLLKNYAKPGDKILDTHGGSCSLAIACDIMGFDCTIYEIDKDYYTAAVERFNRHKQQTTLNFGGEHAN